MSNRERTVYENLFRSEIDGYSAFAAKEINGEPSFYEKLGLRAGNWPHSPDRIQRNIALTEIGLSKNILINLKKQTGYTWAQIAGLIGVSERSLQRMPVTKRFNQQTSERIIGLVEALSAGAQVFGTLRLFMIWLDNPNLAFRNRKPQNLLTTRYGTTQLMNHLWRIEHGVTN